MPTQPRPLHSKPPTIQQPEVIVRRANERAAHEQQQEEEISVAGEKKCFSFRVLLGSSQCYMANGEWEATTESVYWLLKQKAVKTVWKYEIRAGRKRNKRLLKKWLCGTKNCGAWEKCRDVLEWTDGFLFFLISSTIWSRLRKQCKKGWQSDDIRATTTRES